jgi:lipopolysaccharide transport system permease protein
VGLGWVANGPGRASVWGGLREVWAYREVVWFLALRDVKVRYKQAAFGVAWAVFQPLAGVAVFTVLLHHLAGVETSGVPYVLFTYVGMSAWSFLSQAVTESTESLVRNAALVTKVYFPRIAAPLAAILACLLDLAIALVVLVGLLILYQEAPGTRLLLLPLCVLALIAAALGVGMWLAALNVQYRDVRYVIALFVQLWLLVSPVAYPLELVPLPWRWLYALNPAVAPLELFRWSVLDLPLDLPRVGLSLAVTGLLLLGGLVYFQRTERTFADVI